MFAEFKSFVMRGNVLDLAVAVIIGAAFGKIITSLTEDVIMPLIAAIFGNVDFSSRFVILGAVPESYKGSLTDYAALKTAGVAVLGYGSLITAIVNFLIIAFALFLIVRSANKLQKQQEAAPAADPEEIVLLREIRDSLKK